MRKLGFKLSDEDKREEKKSRASQLSIPRKGKKSYNHVDKNDSQGKKPVQGRQGTTGS